MSAVGNVFIAILLIQGCRKGNSKYFLPGLILMVHFFVKKKLIYKKITRKKYQLISDNRFNSIHCGIHIFRRLEHRWQAGNFWLFSNLARQTQKFRRRNPRYTVAKFFSIIICKISRQQHRSGNDYNTHSLIFIFCCDAYYICNGHWSMQEIPQC